MPRRRSILGLSFFAALAALKPSSAVAEVLPLTVGKWQHVTFDGIPPTRYANDGDELVMTVGKSASLLLLPFAKARMVRSVGFEWQSKGALAVKDAAAETTKAGDDYRLRVGLLIAGPAPSIPMIAPAWIKAIRDHMKLSSSRVRFLVAGARHASGKTWASPYSDEMKLWSVKSKSTADGWQAAGSTFKTSIEVVGLWLMADGDATQSSFVTKLRALTLQ